MRRYFGQSGSVAVGTNKALLNLISAATIRPSIFDVVVSSVASPADTTTAFQIVRTTAVGTEGSGFTPTALDPADPASLADIGQGVYGAEPTKTASSAVLSFSVYQRATFRWVAFPGGELVAPATANNGLCLESLSSAGATAREAMIHWDE